MSAAIFLQSSTAVAVLISNFFSKNKLATASGIAMLLGADLGSAIVTQILMIKMSFLTPFLLLVGVSMFLRSKQTTYKQIGQNNNWYIINFCLFRYVKNGNWTSGG